MSTVNVSLTVPMQVSVLADIHQHYLSQTNGTLGQLSADMDATTTGVSVTLDQSKLNAAAQPFAVGDAVMCGAEPMTVATISGLTIGLTRGSFPNVAMATHPSGSPVWLMRYPSPWAMLMDECLRPWTLSVIQGLGNKSLTLASGATGSISQ